MWEFYSVKISELIEVSDFSYVNVKEPGGFLQGTQSKYYLLMNCKVRSCFRTELRCFVKVAVKTHRRSVYLPHFLTCIPLLFWKRHSNVGMFQLHFLNIKPCFIAEWLVHCSVKIRYYSL